MNVRAGKGRLGLLPRQAFANGANPPQIGRGGWILAHALKKDGRGILQTFRLAQRLKAGCVDGLALPNQRIAQSLGQQVDLFIAQPLQFKGRARAVLLFEMNGLLFHRKRSAAPENGGRTQQESGGQ